MGVITNCAFTERETEYLEFLLQHPFPEREKTIKQLNALKPEEIFRTITPYFWMIQFRPDGKNPGQGSMRPIVDVSVCRLDGRVPTEFTIYERNGLVFELEIYNADSSRMDLDRIMEGKVMLHTLA